MEISIPTYTPKATALIKSNTSAYTTYTLAERMLLDKRNWPLNINENLCCGEKVRETDLINILITVNTIFKCLA